MYIFSLNLVAVKTERMKIIIEAKKDVFELRDTIEQHLISEDSRTWELEKYITTASNTVRPVFTHKSNQYNKNAGVKFYINDDDAIVVHLHYATKKAFRIEYVGMVITMLGRTFSEEIDSITVIE